MTATPAVADTTDVLHDELVEARAYVVESMFGGPNMYRLLKERNPQIDMLLNAGIVAGLQLSRDD
jgi:hypothetical protein